MHAQRMTSHWFTKKVTRVFIGRTQNKESFSYLANIQLACNNLELWLRSSFFMCYQMRTLRIHQALVPDYILLLLKRAQAFPSTINETESFMASSLIEKVEWFWRGQLLLVNVLTGVQYYHGRSKAEPYLGERACTMAECACIAILMFLWAGCKSYVTMHPVAPAS